MIFNSGWSLVVNRVGKQSWPGFLSAGCKISGAASGPGKSVRYRMLVRTALNVECLLCDPSRGEARTGQTQTIMKSKERHGTENSHYLCGEDQQLDGG